MTRRSGRSGSTSPQPISKTSRTGSAEHVGPGKPPEPGWSRGVPVDYLQNLARYWTTGFDRRRREAELSEFPQFTTTIAGQGIHFLHVRSPEPDALPLILTRG